MNCLISNPTTSKGGDKAVGNNGGDSLVDVDESSSVGYRTF